MIFDAGRFANKSPASKITKLVIFDLDDTLYDKTGQLSDDLKELNEIRLFSGVKEIIDNLNKNEIKKILVTCGDEVLQRRKLEILGINNSFDNIFICSENSGKEEIFKSVLERYYSTNCNIDKSKIFVIGNRIDSEIKYGNKLGLKTILLRHGKYKNLECKDNLEIPDYEINNIFEIGELIKCKQ